MKSESNENYEIRPNSKLITSNWQFIFLEELGLNAFNETQSCVAVQVILKMKQTLLRKFYLNGHLCKTDILLKQLPRVGPCLSLLLLIDSL